MKRYASIAFVAIMLLLMAAPAVGLIGERRSAGQDMDDYIEERIALREPLIEGHAALSEALWGQSGEEQVIVGKEGWLYFRETMMDFTRQHVMNDRAIERLANRIAENAQALEEAGIGFTFVCAPNKATVYPEHLPYYAVSAGGESNLDRLHAALSARDVDYVDAQAILRVGKAAGQVYYKTDTHWNGRGAMLVYEALAERIGLPAPESGDWAERAIPGDLIALYRPLSAGQEMSAEPVIDRAYSVDGVMRSMDDMIIRTRSDTSGVRLLVYRDSFGEALFPYLANGAGQMTFTRTEPFSRSVADINHVVLEIAERSLPALLAERLEATLEIAPDMAP